MVCSAVRLVHPAFGTLDLDGTPDSDGVFWSWTSLPGWWEGATPSVPVAARPGNDGSTIGSGFQRGRPVTLVGTAWVHETTAEATAVAMLTGARRKIIEAAALVKVAGSLEVDEDEGAGILTRFLTVRRTVAPDIPDQGNARQLRFTIPLQGESWQKFALPLVSSATAGVVVATNGGNAATPPFVHLFGPTDDDPYIDMGGRQVLTDLAAVGVGGHAVIDFAAMTMTDLGGAGDTTHLDAASDFFDLEPGANTVTLGNGGAGGSIRVDHYDGWL